jgi:hypothetical protein
VVSAAVVKSKHTAEHEIRPRHMNLPTVDDYFSAMEDLSRIVRKALDYRESVTRGEVRKALARYERLREAAKRPV